MSAVRPLILVLTLLLPDPFTVCVVVVLVYDPLEFPYSNHTVVSDPLALTAPLRVAVLEVTSVASPVVAVGAADAVLYVTVIVSVAVFPALSVAVTVMVLLPLERLILETLQLVAPLAVSLLPVVLFLHVTLLTPLELSEELPPRDILLLVVV